MFTHSKLQIQLQTILCSTKNRIVSRKPDETMFDVKPRNIVQLLFRRMNSSSS